MTKLQKLREGLEILAQYPSTDLAIYGDALYVGDPFEVSHEDIAQLEDLGFVPGDEDCFVFES